MNSIRLNLLAGVLALGVASGCSDNNLAANPDLTPSPAPADLKPAAAPGDMAQPPDLAYIPNTDGGAFQCGTQTCGVGTVCCVVGTTPMCASSCADGGFVAQCRGPENCGGNPCCITVSSGFMVHDVSCTTQQTDCPPNIDTTSQSGMDRACHVDGDCTAGAPSTNLPDCCTNTMTGQHVCFNKAATGFIPGFKCP